jgi:hypothetical protein
VRTRSAARCFCAGTAVKDFVELASRGRSLALAEAEGRSAKRAFGSLRRLRECPKLSRRRRGGRSSAPQVVRVIAGARADAVGRLATGTDVEDEHRSTRCSGGDGLEAEDDGRLYRVTNQRLRGFKTVFTLRLGIRG